MHVFCSLQFFRRNILSCPSKLFSIPFKRYIGNPGHYTLLVNPFFAFFHAKTQFICLERFAGFSRRTHGSFFPSTPLARRAAVLRSSHMIACSSFVRAMAFSRHGKAPDWNPRRRSTTIDRDPRSGSHSRQNRLSARFGS